MAYVALTDADLDAGSPTKEEIFTRIKANQESFNTDIEALKQTAVIDIIDNKIGGEINSYTEAEIQVRMPVFKAPVSGTMTSVVLTLLEASTSGTLQVDIEISTDNGANFSTVLTSPVEITGTTVGSISGAVNFISAAAQDFNQNDLIRIVVPGLQTGQGCFHVSIYGELA